MTVTATPEAPAPAAAPVSETLAVGGRSIQSWLARQRWWIVRVLLLPLHLAIFTILTFILIRSVPGDPVLAHLGPNYTAEAYSDMQRSMGLDGSVWDQLVRYLGNVVHLDLGTSLSTNKPVLDDFANRLPGTLELAVTALVGCILFSLLLSFLAVFRPRLKVSGVVRGYSRTAGAIPEFVLAIAALFVFYAVLRWAPAPLGRLDSFLSTPKRVTGFPYLDTILTGRFDATASMTEHLVLPLAVLILAQSAILTKILISSLQKSLGTAPTWFRIASGSSKSAVVVSVYRRALPPAVTLCGTLFGYLLGGAVILESLFGFAGMGQYAVTAVTTSDYIAMQGFLLVIAFISLVVFLLVDLGNMLLDPRRRPGVRAEA
ncbi:MAG: peptide/nickel transport system permease protein [Subtercola sp.]|nr:peptide/nickel transport system permease protein [Subtercola sp.]